MDNYFIFVSYNKKYFRPTMKLREIYFINILEAMNINANILGHVLVVSHTFLKFKKEPIMFLKIFF